MVLAHWGIIVDEAALRECCRTATVGTRADDVVACAGSYGFDAQHVRDCNLGDLRRWLATDALPIILLNVFPIDLVWRMHAVVVTGLEGNAVQFLDPVQGQRTAELAAFEQAWQMNLNRAILIVPAGSTASA
jgi:ABC-type bacteriocin/lantibiotic exporter with double-glycine peptidase domain